VYLLLAGERGLRSEHAELLLACTLTRPPRRSLPAPESTAKPGWHS